MAYEGHDQSSGNLPQPPVPPMSVRYVARFAGDGLEMLALNLKHLFFALLTLGIYGFWARAETRRYLWSHTQIGGDRFAWTGTGKETFKGFLKLMGIYVTAGIVQAAAPHVLPAPASYFVTGLIIIGFVAFAPWLIIRAYQYRLSRTRYRGIRFRFHGTVGQAYEILLPGIILCVLTLGIYYPYFAWQWRRFLLTNTSWGQMRGEFSGTPQDMYKIFAKSFFLTILTFGIYLSWHMAAIRRYLHNHTTIGGLRMHCTLRGSQLFVVQLVTNVAVPMTLGIAAPWMHAWRLREIMSSIALEGTIDFAAVAQAEATAAGAGADGLADEGIEIDFFG